MRKSYVLEVLPPRWCMLSDDGYHQCFREGKRTGLHRDKKDAIAEAWGIYEEDFSGEDIEDIAWMKRERDELKLRTQEVEFQEIERDTFQLLAKYAIETLGARTVGDAMLQTLITKVECKCDELIEQGARHMSSHGDGMVKSAKIIKSIAKGEANGD